MAMEMVRTVNDLPDELISQIVSEDCLVAADLFSLVLTSKRFSRIAKPWLYHTIDSRTTSGRKKHAGKGLFPFVSDLVQTLVRHPYLGLYVKRIVLAPWTSTWRGREYSRDEYMPLIQAAQQTRLFTTQCYDYLKRGYHDAQILLFLSFTPNLTELEMIDRSFAQACSLEQLRKATLTPTTSTFRGFPKLKHVRAIATVSGLRYGDDGVDVNAIAFFLCLPAMRTFTAVGADLQMVRVMDEEHYFTHAEIRTDCPAGASSVEVMTFESCVLPCFTLSNPISACKALKSFICRWARGPHYFRLRFEDLRNALLCYKHVLEHLILDVKAVQYVEFPDARSTYIPVDDDHHEYAPLGSLRDFETLIYLEISVIILLGNLETPDLSDLLPPGLETLRLLPPTQRNDSFALQSSLVGLAQSCRRTLPRLRMIDVRDLDVALLGLEEALAALSAVSVEILAMPERDSSST